MGRRTGAQPGRRPPEAALPPTVAVSPGRRAPEGGGTAALKGRGCPPRHPLQVDRSEAGTSPLRSTSCRPRPRRWSHSSPTLHGSGCEAAACTGLAGAWMAPGRAEGRSASPGAAAPNRPARRSPSPFTSRGSGSLKGWSTGSPRALSRGFLPFSGRLHYGSLAIRKQSFPFRRLPGSVPAKRAGPDPAAHQLVDQGPPFECRCGRAFQTPIGWARHAAHVGAIPKARLPVLKRRGQRPV